MGYSSRVVSTRLLHIINHIKNPKKNKMSTKKTTAKKVVAAQIEVPVVAQNEVVESAPQGQSLMETPTEGIKFTLEERATDAKKRERGYSQSAIDKCDLERLNGLKAFVKEKFSVSISNQRIISAALNCLGNNTESFLKGIADEINNKALAKERKAYDELKAKFDAIEAAAATEESKEEIVEATEEAQAE